MILKFKYHCESGLLEAYRSYTLAQNNSLSDTIVITSTAKDADKYNYCLEFICYNSKSIPKAQYISPTLAYADGISFVIPNNLTEFRGHVDMQLTGYDPDDNSVVFKSVGKNCKAFDVEGSLCVLEKDLNDTPNVFTEVFLQLQQLKDVRQDIIDGALKEFADMMLNVMNGYNWYTVRFLDRGEVIKETRVLEGSTLTEPSYTLPEHCVLEGGWYNPKTESVWKESDKVVCDTDLYLNYLTEDVSIVKGEAVDLGAQQKIYLPEYYNGYKVIEIRQDTPVRHPQAEVYLSNNLASFTAIFYEENVYGIYFPSSHPQILSDGGSLYYLLDGKPFLIYVPNLGSEQTLSLRSDCVGIDFNAISSRCNLKYLYLPDSVQSLSSYAVSYTLIEEVTLSGITQVYDNAFFNNANLKRVILKGDMSDKITDSSFVCRDPSNNITSRPTLYVEPQYYQKYKEKFTYEIKVIGQEYFDENYVKKES